MAEVVVLCPICRKHNPRTLANIRQARFCQHCGHSIILNPSGPRFYITRVIKEGGQGAVYQAIGDNGQTYAVKEMLLRAANQREHAETTGRFADETALLQRLRHPRIPQMHARFDEEGRQYLAMEYIYGEDLEQIIERDGALPEARALLLADHLCDVLNYLHAQHPPIIFRDVKPSNIMVEHSGSNIKLIDFGIATLARPTDRAAQIGTPGYAPPEQYQGIATVASDIYSLGATLHHMLTGRDPRDEPPFSFPPVRQLAPHVSAHTAAVIDRALQMEPVARFRTVAELRAAFHPQQPPQVRRPTPPPTRRPAAPAAPPQMRRPAAPPPAQSYARPAAAPAMPRPGPAAAPAPRPAAAPRRAPQRRRRRIAGWIETIKRLLIACVVLLTLALGALWYAAPDVVRSALPGTAPTAVPTLESVLK